MRRVVLSKGPGSYTGLRIGTSIAKGLCYSLEIPLVSVSTLKAMAFGISKEEDYKFYCPMIDARRMEVFSSIFDQSNNEVREIIKSNILINFFPNTVHKTLLVLLCRFFVIYYLETF